MLYLSISSEDGKKILFEKEFSKIRNSSLKTIFDTYLKEKSQRSIDQKEGIVILKMRFKKRISLDQVAKKIDNEDSEGDEEREELHVDPYPFLHDKNLVHPND